MLIDTHTHLYLEQFDEDREAVIQRAIEVGVHKMYLPNIDSSTIEGMLQMETAFKGHCFAMMGLHPCSVKENYTEELQLVKEWIDKRDFAAIGEIGIDLYWDKTFLKEQQIAFRQQIQWAKEKKRPIVIHARESMEEILEIVEDENDDSLKGIFHCYSGNEKQTQRILDLGGFLFGIGGVITFKNSGKSLRNVLSMIDMNYIVLETDAPYITPTPYRGKRNESAYIPFIAKQLSELKGAEIEKIAELSTNNAEKLFSPFV